MRTAHLLCDDGISAELWLAALIDAGVPPGLLQEAIDVAVILNALRAAFQRSQAELAAELGVTQSAVSQLERGGDVKISTLRNYLRGLGADLQITAVFTPGDDETVVPLRIAPTGE
jgi:DNA-binding XRE family transcriptional regulator